jgi:hypothetical protein
MALRATEGTCYGPAVELTEEQKQQERAYIEHKRAEERSRIEGERQQPKVCPAA